MNVKIEAFNCDYVTSLRLKFVNFFSPLLCFHQQTRTGLAHETLEEIIRVMAGLIVTS